MCTTDNIKILAREKYACSISKQTIKQFQQCLKENYKFLLETMNYFTVFKSANEFHVKMEEMEFESFARAAQLQHSISYTNIFTHIKNFTKKRPYRSDNSTNEFWRYEFFLSLCEFSFYEMNAFKKNEHDKFIKCFSRVINKVKNNIKQLLPQNGDDFRLQHLYREETDTVFEKWLDVLKAAFNANSGINWSFNDTQGTLSNIVKSKHTVSSVTLSNDHNKHHSIQKRVLYRRNKKNKWKKSMVAVRMSTKKKSVATAFKGNKMRGEVREEKVSNANNFIALNSTNTKLALAGYKINFDGSVSASRMSCHGWINFLKQNKLISDTFSILHAKHVFIQSKMMVCDEIHEYDKSRSLSWCDFLEALCRTAHFLYDESSAIASFQKLMEKIENLIRDHNYEENKL
jgi:hypothetical protein